MDKTSHSNTCMKHIVGTAYRHTTTQYENFICALTTSILNIVKTNQTFYLCGDFNVNIAPDSPNHHADVFIEMLLTDNAFSTITIPTRVTDNSKTIIDSM